jgi:filamentous hemagglutinin family protein
VKRATTIVTQPRPRPLAAALALACAGMGISTSAQAQIRTDGSVGAAVSLTGPSYSIPQTLGKLAGNNLFQSFAVFNLAAGESATFSTSTPGIANVISRVTGGSPSLLYGNLALSAASGTPALFFINPAGVLFGAGASIDVPGAFHASTANYLKFGDGAVLYADLGHASSFTSAPPQAFGFLGSTRAPLVVRDGAVLAPNALQPLNLVAGDIALDNGLVAASGEVRLVATGQAATEVGLSGAPPAAAGQLAIVNGGAVVTSTARNTAAGRVWASAGDVQLDSGGSISSFTATGSSAAGGGISIAASGNLSLGNGASLYLSTSGSGRGGDLSVAARNIALSGGSYVISGPEDFSSGNGGDMRFTAGQAMTLDSGASIASSNTAKALGNAGGIAITTGTLTVGSNAYITSTTVGPGGAGDLAVNASGAVTLNGGNAAANINGGLLASYSTLGGAAGKLLVSARDVSVLAGGQILATVQGSGQPGALTLNASGTLTVQDAGSLVSTSGVRGGNAGKLTVNAGNVVVDGAGINSGSLDNGGASGDVAINAGGKITLVNGAFILATTSSLANAGNVSLVARDISLDGDSSVQSNAAPPHDAPPTGVRTGNAGSVSLTASNSITLAGASLVTSSTSTQADSGSVHLSAPDMRLSGNSIVSTSSSGLDSGQAGSVDIAAPGSLTLQGGSGVDSSSVSPIGNAGTVNASVGRLVLDGSGLFSLAEAAGGSGRAGSVTVLATGDVSLGNGASLSTTTLGKGNAGTVSVQAGGNITVASGSQVESNTSGAGAAGSVSLRAANITVDGYQSAVQADAGAGSGGQPGSVSLQAGNSITVSNQAQASIITRARLDNPATITPTTLSLNAPTITLANGAVLAAATGNINSSDVSIQASQQLTLAGGVVSINTVDGSGGNINIDGGQLMLQAPGLITSSVLGTQQGNGGNIRISADALVLATGFIQANTAAPNANGGLVSINANTLVASGNTLFVGGSTSFAPNGGVFGYNVIQAAAPTGVSGVVTITSPVLDVSGSLAALTAQVLDSGGLGRSPCQASAGSSLAQAGRGGLAPSLRAPLSGLAGNAAVGPQAASDGKPPWLEGLQAPRYAQALPWTPSRWTCL